MACSAAPGLRRRMRAFRRDEDGSLLVLGLVLFSIFFLMGGMAIDVMRAENRRVALAQTLDRCALNAAALSQALNPDPVLRDCMDRKGLETFLTSVRVTDQNNSRTVAANGTVPVETLFMHSMGIKSLPMQAATRAEQGASRIEIVLALDVSGSMNSSQRIEGLRAAARSFVTRVLTGNTGLISIAIVPYNQQVNLGPDLAAQLNIINAPRNIGVTANGDMANVNCVDLPGSAFAQAGISPSQEISSTGFVDLASLIFGGRMVDSYYTTARSPSVANTMCPQQSQNFISLPTDNIQTLHAKIDALTANGGTSINLGMKWASVLLDPRMRPAFDTLIAANRIPSQLRDRPFDYNSPNTRKIVVLMTDGENWAETRVNPAFLGGQSPIYLGTDGNFSIHHGTGRPASAGGNEYWVPHRSEWRAIPWGGTESTQGEQLSWNDAWQRLTAAWTSWQLYARALGTSDAERRAVYNTQLETFRIRRGTATSAGGVTTVSAPELDQELSQVCAATRAQGVLIYGIAFSAPANGITALSDCATSPAYFFRSTDNASLNAAFQAIAINITQLRLTN